VKGGTRRFARTAWWACACAAVALVPRAARAQGEAPLPAATDDTVGAAAVRCAGETVRDIVIYSGAPTVAGLRKLPVIADLARATHVTTQPDVVRRFLLVREGAPCTELARAESERVLRAQPFIADAQIDVVRADSGGVRLEVRTIDEVSLVFGTRVQSDVPFVRTLRVGNGNVAGSGIYLAGEWRDGRTLRNGGALTVIHNQFMGAPYVLHLHARRSPLGGEWQTALTRPFLTGFQRQAWRMGGGQVTSYTTLRRPEAPDLAARIERHYFDAGAMGRVGSPTVLGLFGMSVSHESEQAGASLVSFRDDGAPTDGGLLPAVAPAYHSTRINALLGVRALRFVRAEGFDALTARQDLAFGFRAGAVIGRGLTPPRDASDRRELFAAADVYAGTGSPTQATRLQLRAQGADLAESGAWGRVIASGRLAHQRKPSPSRTIELSTEWGGAWRPGVPFQLLLGAREGGVRGYGDSRVGGARRAVLRLEERRALGKVGTFGDLGVAAFTNAGRIWRGDAPFGVTTPIRTSLGLSLLAAVPARSARLWRLDLAMPVQGPGAGRVEVGFSNADRTTVFWREPRDITFMRDRTVPASVFAWP